MATETATLSSPAQGIVLHGVTWESYEQLLEIFRDRSGPRLTYDRGVLEIVSPTLKHEEDHLALAKVVEIVAEEWDIEYRPVGSTTYRRQSLAQGFEADSSFYLGSPRFTQGFDQIDPTVDPPPDLVIEVDVSHSSLDKLPIFAGFAVPEVWRCRGDEVAMLVRDGDTYRDALTSTALPMLDRAVLTRFLRSSRTPHRLAWVRAVRAWAREQGIRASG